MMLLFILYVTMHHVLSFPLLDEICYFKYISLLPWYRPEFPILSDGWNLLFNSWYSWKMTKIVFFLLILWPGLRWINYFLPPGISISWKLLPFTRSSGDETRMIHSRNVIVQSNMANIINGSEIAKTMIPLRIVWFTMIAYFGWCIHQSLSINEKDFPLSGGSRQSIGSWRCALKQWSLPVFQT